MKTEDTVRGRVRWQAGNWQVQGTEKVIVSGGTDHAGTSWRSIILSQRIHILPLMVRTGLMMVTVKGGERRHWPWTPRICMRSSLPWELLEESLLFLLDSLVCNSPPALGVVAVKSLQLLEASVWDLKMKLMSWKTEERNEAKLSLDDTLWAPGPSFTWRRLLLDPSPSWTNNPSLVLKPLLSGIWTQKYIMESGSWTSNLILLILRNNFKKHLSKDSGIWE